MEKKSVNGKSFDEVFSERGELASMESFVSSSIYFCEATPTDHAAIFDFGKNMVVENGSYVLSSHYNDAIFAGCVTREATPDQILLLNSYRNA